MIFVDTSAWFALYSSRDPNHAKVLEYLQGTSELLVTSDYVVDETLTLLRAKGLNSRAAAFGRRIFELRSISLVAVEDDDLLRAWRIFRDYSDKGWSFTDCTTFALIERLGIATALAFDRHFVQFGNVNVVP